MIRNKNSKNRLFIKIVCVIFSLFALASSISIFASQQAHLSVGSTLGYRGDKVNISISINNPEGVTGLQFSVKYNYNSVSISEVDIVKGSALDGWIFEKNVIAEKGEIKFACASSHQFQGKNSIEVCNIKFTVKSDANYGEVPILIEDIFVGDGDSKLHVGVSNGTINILNSQTPLVTPSVLPKATSKGSVAKTPILEIRPSVSPAESINQPVDSKPSVSKFVDIEGHWAAPSILRLINAGVVSGYPDGTLRPDTKITRAEMVTILVKALDIENLESSQIGFSDENEVPEWALKYIGYAAKNNIIKGYEDNTFRANRYVTRSEIAVLIVKTFSINIEKSSGFEFVDSLDIPWWAKEFVIAAALNNIVRGYEDNTFRPLNDITRAEAFAMLEKAMLD